MSACTHGILPCFFGKAFCVSFLSKGTPLQEGVQKATESKFPSRLDGWVVGRYHAMHI